MVVAGACARAAVPAISVATPAPVRPIARTMFFPCIMFVRRYGSRGCSPPMAFDQSTDGFAGAPLMSTSRRTAAEHLELHELADGWQFGALADRGADELGRDVQRLQLDQ